MTVFIIVGEGLIGRTYYQNIFCVYEDRAKAAERLVTLAREYPKVEFTIEKHEVVE